MSLSKCDFVFLLDANPCRTFQVFFAVSTDGRRGVRACCLWFQHNEGPPKHSQRFQLRCIFPHTQKPRCKCATSHRALTCTRRGLARRWSSAGREHHVMGVRVLLQVCPGQFRRIRFASKQVHSHLPTGPQGIPTRGIQYLGSRRRRGKSEATLSINHAMYSVMQLYCQNLTLFGKLFIDVKTLFFDCANCASARVLYIPAC